MSKTTKVTAINGTEYAVRLLEKGDYYGLDNKLTHESIEPMIEFYDVKHPHCYDFVGSKKEAEEANAECWGQFITRYNLSTVLEGLATTVGLSLHGGVPAWIIDGMSLRHVMRCLHVWDGETTIGVGDVVKITDRNSTSCGLQGVVMGEEVWTSDNSCLCWEGTGERPAFTKSSGLDHPPTRRWLLHLFSPDPMYDWRMEKFLEGQKKAGDNYPYWEERHLTLIYTPTFESLDDNTVARFTRHPFTVSAVGIDIAHTRVALAHALQSHLPYILTLTEK